MASPRGYHCRRTRRHAFVDIFEVLWSDGPPDRKEEKKLKEEAEKKMEEAREVGKEEKWIVVGQRGRRRVLFFGKQPHPMTLVPLFRQLRPVARAPSSISSKVNKYFFPTQNAYAFLKRSHF